MRVVLVLAILLTPISAYALGLGQYLGFSKPQATNTTPSGPAGDGILLEGGGYVLLETNDYLLKE